MTSDGLEDKAQGKPLRVLVTGANGFVGSAVAALCRKHGMLVSTTGRSGNNSETLPNYFRADVTEPDSLSEAMSGVEAVVHAAGHAHQFTKSHDEAPFMAINAKGTENVARTALQSGVRHFVLISSVSVYGSHEEMACDEQTPCRPLEAYARSKFEAEQRAIEIFKNTETCLTILRLATVYGEGDRGNVARLMRQIALGRFIWIGRGANRKSLIHLDDVARACLAVLRSRCEGIGVYNVSSPAHTMREIVEGLYHALKKPAPRWRVPQGLAVAAASLLEKIAPAGSKPGAVKGTVRKWLADDVYDAKKFQQQFNFQTEVTLEEGLQREVAEYRQRVR